jgi:hypothetical protein
MGKWGTSEKRLFGPDLGARSTLSQEVEKIIGNVDIIAGLKGVGKSTDAREFLPPLRRLTKFRER